MWGGMCPRSACAFEPPLGYAGLLRGPGQHERIVRLIRRRDHLSNAVDTVREAAGATRDRVYAEGYILGQLVPFLEGEHADTLDELRRYKREIGLLGEE